MCSQDPFTHFLETMIDQMTKCSSEFMKTHVFRQNIEDGVVATIT